MPEGDTLYRAALMVGKAIGGSELVDVSGSFGPLRSASGKLRGATVTDVRSHGKNLVIDTSVGLAIRTHLMMSGEWHVYQPVARWRNPIGAARVVLETSNAVAVCFSAPDISVDTPAAIAAELDHLGPDLCADDFDREEAVRRLCQPQKNTLAEHLADQRVMAGVGNVYKSEILFLERLHPKSEPRVAESVAEALVDRSRQLLMLNRERPTRVTTAETRRGAELWVYGRGGKPCRRCRTRIEAAWVGDVERITYWCPNCQTA